MRTFVTRRLLQMVPVIFLISVLGFVLIQLPPGDFLTNYIAGLEANGQAAARQEAINLTERYKLDQPPWRQYLRWVSGMFQGDFGDSFQYRKPVMTMLGERMALTVTIALSTLAFSWLVAIPIGIISAVRQYSLWDHLFTFIGFIGLSVPNFLFALVLLTVSVFFFDVRGIGLFSPEYAFAPWSAAKVVDLFKHLWIPVVVIGTADTASIIRIMRGNLLDVLPRDHVKVARSKGLRETMVIVKHAVPLAINPLISQLGTQLPNIISGSIIVSVVLGLPTGGALFYEAIRNQDMFLAGTYLLFAAGLLLIGNFLADLALASLDPRIRYD